MEDWAGAFPARTLSKESFQEMPSTANSSASSTRSEQSTRFSFNGIDKLSFALSRGSKREWEITLPPVEYSQVWGDGAWSGLSLVAKEIHHFYIRNHRRGPEPKYRVYSLSPDWELIDFETCSKYQSYLLEKSLKTKNLYKLTAVRMLHSQELKREAAWSFEVENDQEFLSLKSNSCKSLQIDGWPKSYALKL
ncbi:MAG: hypothetical protein R3A80_07980 [Bdellovibrionota bacterium]